MNYISQIKVPDWGNKTMNNRIRPVQIQQVMNGYLVQVGCQTLVFESQSTLLVELGKYMEQPETIEREYRHKHGLNEDCPMPEPAANRVMNERETMKAFVGERNEAKHAR